MTRHRPSFGRSAAVCSERQPQHVRIFNRVESLPHASISMRRRQAVTAPDRGGDSLSPHQALFDRVNKRPVEFSCGARLGAPSTNRSMLGWPTAQKSFPHASIFKFLRLASEAQSRSNRLTPIRSRPADGTSLSPRERAGVRGKSLLNSPLPKLLYKLQSTLRRSLPARNEWESRRERSLLNNTSPLIQFH
jgi:hypothetical protein